MGDLVTLFGVLEGRDPTGPWGRIGACALLRYLGALDALDQPSPAASYNDEVLRRGQNEALAIRTELQLVEGDLAVAYAKSRADNEDRRMHRMAAPTQTLHRSPSAHDARK